MLREGLRQFGLQIGHCGSLVFGPFLGLLKTSVGILERVHPRFGCLLCRAERGYLLIETLDRRLLRPCRLELQAQSNQLVQRRRSWGTLRGRTRRPACAGAVRPGAGPPIGRNIGLEAGAFANATLSARREVPRIAAGFARKSASFVGAKPASPLRLNCLHECVDGWCTPVMLYQAIHLPQTGTALPTRRSRPASSRTSVSMPRRLFGLSLLQRRAAKCGASHGTDWRRRGRRIAAAATGAVQYLGYRH